MKSYTTEMMKLIALLVVTPLLVMIYTKVEKRIAVSDTAQTQDAGVSGITPVSIGMINKEMPPIAAVKNSNDFVLVQYTGPVFGTGTKLTRFTKNIVAANRFSLILL